MTRSLLVYLGYPADLHPNMPTWSERLFHETQEGAPFHYFVSGGVINEGTMETLKERETKRIGKLARALEGTYQARMLGSLQQMTPDEVASQLSSGILSSEGRVLADLWVMARADVYLVDCDAVGRARTGMEALYATLMGLESIGVTDTPTQDPWFHCHLGRLVRPHDILSHLWQVRDSLEIVSQKMEEAKDTAPAAESEPHEISGFGD